MRTERFRRGESSLANMPALRRSAFVPEEQRFVLSSLPPSPAQKRLAFGIVLGLSLVLYLVIGPFGGMQLGAIHSFVALYTSAMFVTAAKSCSRATRGRGCRTSISSWRGRDGSQPTCATAA